MTTTNYENPNLSRPILRQYCGNNQKCIREKNSMKFKMLLDLGQEQFDN